MMPTSTILQSCLILSLLVCVARSFHCYGDVVVVVVVALV